MANTTSPVCVRLEVITRGESHPVRYLTLEAPSYSVRIGRGSRSGSKDLYPDRHNAWFDSRVMSREHAVLRASPESKTLSIEDVGSMHGTYLEGDRLALNRPRLLEDGDPVLFGAEVSRGSDVFPALEIDVFYTWRDNATITPAPQAPPSFISRNSFSVPDYESEEGDDDEIMEVFPTVTYPQIVEVVIPSEPTAVPESEFSNGGSIISDESDGEIPEARSGIQLTGLQQDLPTDHEGKMPPKDQANGSSSQQQSSLKFVYITDSESDYGDELSADDLDNLESDEHEDTDVLPDSSSFSSQSPLSTGIRSKIDLAAIHKAKSAPQMLASTQNFDTGATTDKATTTYPSTDAVRPPSPSDAAMAKPTPSNVEPPPWATNGHLGASSNYWNTPSSLYQIPNREMSGSSSWPAPNSDWYPPSQPSFSSMPIATYTTQPRYTFEGYNAVPQQAYPGEYRSLSSYIGEEPEQQNPHFPQSACPFVTIKTTPRVSVKDTARAVTPEQEFPVVAQHSKRTADEISTGGKYDEAAVATASISSDPENPNSLVDTSLSATLVVPVVAEERPNKRVKVNSKESTKEGNGSFMKYAGTALAGVAFGAVGAIAALVALPPDFFI